MKRLSVFLLMLFTAVPVLAQVDLGASLYLAVSPQFPKPGETVTLTVQNPLADLSQRTVTWHNGSTVVLTGEGETVYKTNAPAAGEYMDISVIVEGESAPASITIAPSSVDLMWESNSYAPGLYRGRHLASLGSTLSLQALPHVSQKGVELPASSLYFTWKRDGQVLQSGKGLSSISVPVAAFVDTSTIAVSVTTADKKTGAERAATVRVAEPSVRLYVEHPLYGTMFHDALPARTNVSDTEMSFAAIPYFAQASDPNDKQFSYLWKVNRAAIEPNDEKPNTLVINAGPAGGEAAVELSLTHKKFYQLDASGIWNIVFGSITAAGSDLFTE